jgi:hypothetical protein
MASKTAITEHRRKRKIHSQGKARKRKLRREGSTRTQAELFGDAKK